MVQLHFLGPTGGRKKILALPGGGKPIRNYRSLRKHMLGSHPHTYGDKDKRSQPLVPRAYSF